MDDGSGHILRLKGENQLLQGRRLHTGSFWLRTCSKSELPSGSSKQSGWSFSSTGQRNDVLQMAPVWQQVGVQM